MYKDNAVGTMIAETGRDCGTTARLSDLSMPFQLCASPLKGEVRRSREPSVRSVAADSEKRQIRTTCLFADSVGLEKEDDLMLSPIVEHTQELCLSGERERFDMAAHSETPKPSCPSHKQRRLRPRSGPSKGAHNPTKDSKY